MGFVFYANIVRLVLEGGYSLVLLERARAFMKTSAVWDRVEQ
jgi:hypothetical protein